MGPVLRYILPILILFGCEVKPESDQRVVATAFEESLYWTELRGVVPLEVPYEDSVALANSYINSWLRNQTILAKAKENLADSDIDIERKINDYRNSLLIYSYERRIVDQKLDTVVNDEELRLHYDSNRADFKLKEDVARLRWCMIPVSDMPKNERKLLGLMCDEDPEKKSEFEKILAENDIEITDYSDQWIRWNAVSIEVPLAERDKERTGERSCWMIESEDVRYFVHLLEHRSNATMAPFELVRDELKAIVLNKRKAELLESVRAKLFEEAQRNGNVRINE